MPHSPRLALAALLLCPVASTFAQEDKDTPRTRPELIKALNEVRKDTAAQIAIHGRVLGQGVRGAELLLNVFYPESVRVPAVDSPQGKAWVRDLASGNAEKSKAALVDVYHFGPVAAPFVDELAKTAEPALRLWLRGVRVSWDEEKLHHDCLPQFWGPIWKTKDPAILVLLAERAVILLEKKHDHDVGELAHRIIGLLGDTGEDRFLDPLLPLLEHPDAYTVRRVVVTVAQHRGPWAFPNFMFKALSHKRFEVVDAALGWTTTWDKDLQPAVRKVLRAIFEGDNEALKFHACFGLAAAHKDAEAYSYIVGQTLSKDSVRVNWALRMLGYQHMARKPAPAEMLKNVAPLLAASDKEIRYNAAWALGQYKGEEVVRRLIPCLGDAEPRIAKAVHDALLYNWNSDWDRKALRRYLEEARFDDDPAIQKGVRALLEKIAK